MEEESKNDSPIYRHRAEDEIPFEAVSGEESNIELISQHIEAHVGEIDSVFHELISDKVHIDVHWVKPSAARPFHTFVTSGMSDRPMATPEGMEEYQYAELCILLPKHWGINEGKYQLMEKVFEGEYYWPIYWLKYLARFPHNYSTWLASGHTIPNGEEAAPFETNTGLGCMLLLPTISFSDAFNELTVSPNKKIRFYGLYPIYRDEMQFKLENGLDALIDKLQDKNVSDILAADRPNTCKKKGFWDLFR
ncbi:MAG: suppressor of fused domain protein [Bacteroidota bacterium]